MCHHFKFNYKSVSYGLDMEHARNYTFLVLFSIISNAISMELNVSGEFPFSYLGLFTIYIEVINIAVTKKLSHTSYTLSEA